MCTGKLHPVSIMLKNWAVVLIFLSVFGAFAQPNIPSADYSVEMHYVVTYDGYILGVQRISSTYNFGSDPKKVVLLVHGLTVSSESFTFAGPENAIGYHLVDAGFDVWLGNCRGNSYSRHHVSLDPDTDKKEFFKFSYEEIALIDLPVMIDFILQKTGQENLFYIGHSQGGTIFYVLNSMSTAYHSKIASAHLLAGIGYTKHLPNLNMKILSKSIDVIYSALLLSGNVEMILSDLSLAVVEILVGSELQRELFAGASVKQFVHFLQNMRDEVFQRFNFGNFGNVQKYGTILPPLYNLSNINIDVTLHYSLGDATQSEKDALAMANAMPKARARKVARETFSHLDYLAAPDAKKLVTDYIIQCIKAS